MSVFQDRNKVPGRRSRHFGLMQEPRLPAQTKINTKGLEKIIDHR